MSERTNYCGFVAIVGKSNVGKSTLLNRLLGQKISITSRKPQTTRYRIIGIHTKGPYQAIYVDTPGLNINSEEKYTINRFINRTARNSISDMQLVIFLVEGTYWTLENDILVNKLRNVSCPVILAINKMDLLKNKEQLLPYIQFISQKMSFYEIVPICAKSGMNIDTLASIVCKALPESDHHFPEDYITNRSQRFMASEIIREKLIRFLGDELPYSIVVKIERFTINNRGNYNINSLILVKRKGQKKIIIGHEGSKIKIIGVAARKDMEAMFKLKVNLELWVTVQSNRGDNERILRNLGYIDDL